jgi:hypothetical protein
MRRTRRALVGDGGETGGRGGDAPRSGVVTRNDVTRNAIGVALNDFVSIRSTPGPATDMAGPSGQQLVQGALRRRSNESWDDAVASPVAADSFDTGDAWCAWAEATAETVAVT